MLKRIFIVENPTSIQEIFKLGALHLAEDLGANSSRGGLVWFIGDGESRISSPWPTRE